MSSVQKQPLVIGFYGGPGISKSTSAAQLFSLMKQENMSCELVTEYAKDLTWENNHCALECQMYVTGNQLYRIKRVSNKVDYIITDSPILTGCFYSSNEFLNNAILYENSKLNTLNILLKRCKPYHEAGRIQTEEQAINIDHQIKQFLIENAISFKEIDGKKEAIESLFLQIKGIS